MDTFIEAPGLYLSLGQAKKQEKGSPETVTVTGGCGAALLF